MFPWTLRLRGGCRIAAYGSGRAYQADGIFRDMRCDRHAADEALVAKDVGRSQHGLRLRRRPARRAVHDLHLLRFTRVIHEDVHHESIELRLGEWISSLHLDGVLRRQNEERQV